MKFQGKDLRKLSLPLVLIAATLLLLVVFLADVRQPRQPLTQTPSRDTAMSAETRAPDTILLPATGFQDGQAQVGLYGLFETQVSNDKSYSNPYDYRVIELQAAFSSPSGKQYEFFGFYDGNGQGGLAGSLWRLRFMPDETGIWTYAYTWTDGTPGGSGSFEVIDTGIPGPLRVDGQNSEFFTDARGNPFHWRGYSLHRYIHAKYGRTNYSSQAWNDLRSVIRSKVAERGYNALMLRYPTNTRGGADFSEDVNGSHFWQQQGADLDFTRFYIPQWEQVEDTLQAAGEQGVYVFQFAAMVDQNTPRPNADQLRIFTRYMAARLGPYWNNFGYSPTWEYQDIWSNSEANGIMSGLNEDLQGLPIPPLLSIHDHSNNSFAGWLDFSMRQRGAVDVFGGNCRSCGKHGGSGSEFVDQPVVGSEDIWEIAETVDTPKNGLQVSRGAFGEMMAGVLPVYMEETGSNGAFNGEGEPHMRHIYDFFYQYTRYREYKLLNNLVSREMGQAAAGIPKVEYLVFDQKGGSIQLNLSGAPSSTSFDALWFNPMTGETQEGEAVSGGKIQSFTAPNNEDWALLLTQSNAGSTGLENIFLPLTLGPN